MNGTWDEFPGAADLEPLDGTGLGDRLLLDLDGTTFGLPAAAESPGLEESVTLTDETGMTICSDTDGDGRVDSMSVVTFDGGWSSWRLQECMSYTGTDVSSVTESDNTPVSHGDGSPGTNAGENGAEQGEPYGQWEEVPPSTPGNGRRLWDARGWECVDRGKWG